MVVPFATQTHMFFLSLFAISIVVTKCGTRCTVVLRTLQAIAESCNSAIYLRHSKLNNCEESPEYKAGQRVNVKVDPKLSIYSGRYSKRVHVDVRLTAAEERGLYNALVKRYGES
jgi:hypothetical protein